MVTDLLLKSERNKPLTHVEQIDFNTQGISGNVSCLQFRQVLLVPRNTLIEFGLNPGDLRENIVIDYDKLHELPSGTVVKIGEALIRLTFHCEPCKVIQNKVKLRGIAHRRGYLGLFLNSGTIKQGDNFIVLEQQFESIPYSLTERLKWYLDKQDHPISVQQLLADIGLSHSYARAIPNMLKTLPPSYTALVVFRTRHDKNTVGKLL